MWAREAGAVGPAGLGVREPGCGRAEGGWEFKDFYNAFCRYESHYEIRSLSAEHVLSGTRGAHKGGPGLSFQLRKENSGCVDVAAWKPTTSLRSRPPAHARSGCRLSLFPDRDSCVCVQRGPGRETGAGLMRGGWRRCGHVQGAGVGQHAVGLCDDGASSQARGGDDEGAGGADGGDVGHAQRVGRGKHAVGALHRTSDVHL